MAHSDGLRRVDDKLQRRDPGAGGIICHNRNRTGSPMVTIGRSASQKKGEEVPSGWKQHLKTAAPRPTTRRKMFGRTAITSRPTPHQMGGHQAKPVRAPAGRPRRRHSVFSLLLFCFASFFGEGFGGKEIEVPRLDGRTPHLGAEKRSLGAGLERSFC